MKIRKNLFALAPFALALPFLAGCPEEDGSLEKAGEKADEAVEEAGDEIEDAADEAEEAVDEAADEADDAS